MKKNLIAKMLEEAKTDINVRNRLIEEYMHVIDKILISDDEDARAFLNLSLVEIIDKYLETNQKIPLSQYINRNIKICYKNYLNKKYPSYDYCLSSKYEYDDIVLNSEISSILNNLTDFEREVIIRYFFNNDTFENIGKVFNFQKSWTSFVERRGIERIRNLYQMDEEDDDVLSVEKVRKK